MSVEEKIDSCEEAARELLSLSPNYKKEYLKRKFAPKGYDEKEIDTQAPCL